MKKPLKFLSLAAAAVISLSAASQASVSAVWYKNADGKYFYTDSDGNRCTGWQTIKGSKYYFDDKGYMKKGWHREENGDYYYLMSNGKAACGCSLKINGKVYSFDENGVYVPKAQKPNKSWKMNEKELIETGCLEGYTRDDSQGPLTYMKTIEVSGIEGLHIYLFMNDKFAGEIYSFAYSEDNLTAVKDYFTKAYGSEPYTVSDTYLEFYVWQLSSSDVTMVYDSDAIMLMLTEKK